MDAVKERFLETSRKHLTARSVAAAPSERLRTRVLKREAKRFPQSAAVHAAITLLRRCSI